MCAQGWNLGCAGSFSCIIDCSVPAEKEEVVLSHPEYFLELRARAVWSGRGPVLLYLQKYGPDTALHEGEKRGTVGNTKAKGGRAEKGRETKMSAWRRFFVPQSLDLLPTPRRGWRRSRVSPRARRWLPAALTEAGRPRGSSAGSWRPSLFVCRLPWERSPALSGFQRSCASAPGVPSLWTCPRLPFPTFSPGRGDLGAKRQWLANMFSHYGVRATCVGRSPKWGRWTTDSHDLEAAGACQARQGSQAEEGRQRPGGFLFCFIIYLMVRNFYNFF